ncbi:MAG: hypothetical protein R3308_01580, partial [Thiohalobacterales bacterium]|nr:hypothetical protein [Thiohalobacterales bacterium]
LNFGWGERAPAAPLVEPHDAITTGIEETPVIKLAGCARATVHENGRQTVGVPAFLDVQGVAVTHVNGVGAIRLNRRVQTLH